MFPFLSRASNRLHIIYIFIQGGLYVLVSVQPEGFVAIPGVRERKDVIFNIGKDEFYQPIVLCRSCN